MSVCLKRLEFGSAEQSMVLYKTVVLLSACACFLGPRELPRLGHLTGYGVGRAIGAINRARAAVSRLVDDGELGDMRDEIRKDLDELRKIQREIRSAPSIHGIISSPPAHTLQDNLQETSLSEKNMSKSQNSIEPETNSFLVKKDSVSTPPPSDSAQAQPPVALILGEFPMSGGRIKRIGLDLSQCSPELQAAIEQERARQDREKEKKREQEADDAH